MRVEEFKMHYEQYSDWLLSLKQMDSDKWLNPIAEGKWSIAAIVSHLLSWDKHILTEKIPVFKEGAIIDGYPDFQTHNHSAMLYAHNGISKEMLIDEIINERLRYMSFLDLLSEEDLKMSFTIGGHPHTLEDFLIDFAEHDVHHQKQIAAALEEVEATS